MDQQSKGVRMCFADHTLLRDFNGQIVRLRRMRRWGAGVVPTPMTVGMVASISPVP